MNKEKLTELIYINLGQASMCWSEIPKGVFDSTKAAELGQEIMDAIEKGISCITCMEEHHTLESLKQLLRSFLCNSVIFFLKPLLS